MRHALGMAQAPLALRPDASLYSIDGGWFRARWHFSFDRYRDQKHMGIGTLRVFNHDTLVPGAVWPMHPHRDIEGITFVVAGEFEHRDSLGNGGVLLPGGVQRMRLGSGAEHSEGNHSKTEEMQFIQMWILPWRRGLAPDVEQRQLTAADRTDRLMRFLKPEGADGEGVTVAQDVSMYASRLSPGKSVTHAFGPSRGGYLYLIEGAMTANGERMTTGDAAYVTDAGSLEAAATETSELLVIDTPLR
jgi:redox-sensitive bicupin YhaK (pirin superfamily)